MGAAFFAPGEAFIHAVTIGLVGDDENAAVGGGDRGTEQGDTGQEGTGSECGESHGDTGEDQGTVPTNRPKALIMINHEPAGRQKLAGFRRLIGRKSGTSKALTTAL